MSCVPKPLISLLDVAPRTNHTGAPVNKQTGYKDRDKLGESRTVLLCLVGGVKEEDSLNIERSDVYQQAESRRQCSGDMGAGN